MLVDSGKAQEALPIAQSVVEARTRVLGADHPQTLRAKLNLATAYARLEQFDKTLPLQAEVAQARMRLLGPRHPDTIFILINQAGSLQQMGRSQEALAAIGRVLPLAIEVLGDHHPQAQAAMQIRADSASSLGDHALAIASYRDWFEARRKALGEGDAGTIDAAWRLEGELLAAGQREEAARLRARYVTPLLQAKPDSLSPELARTADNIRETEHEEASTPVNTTAKAGKG
jgi:non-specific serine/threonine protein kinase/serine/threonine-protein kinase